MSFDLHYSSSSRNERWKAQIDPTFAKKDWYLHKLSTWGNEAYVCRRVFVYYLVELCITIGIYLYVQLFNMEYIHVWSILDCALFFPPVCIINYTYYRSPKIDENLYFKFEYRTTTFAVCMGWGVFWSSALVETFGSRDIAVLLAVIAYISAGSVPSLLSTVWIPLKVKSNALWVRATTMCVTLLCK